DGPAGRGDGVPGDCSCAAAAARVVPEWSPGRSASWRNRMRMKSGLAAHTGRHRQRPLRRVRRLAGAIAAAALATLSLPAAAQDGKSTERATKVPVQAGAQGKKPTAQGKKAAAQGGKVAAPALDDSVANRLFPVARPVPGGIARIPLGSAAHAPKVRFNGVPALVVGTPADWTAIVGIPLS